MHFDLSDDQREIRATARDLLAARSGWEAVRAAAEGDGHDGGLWRELGELGWPGIAVPEAHGGQGLGLVELAVLLEETGFACAPVPLLGTALAGLAVTHAGDDGQRAAHLPGLASGERTGAAGGDGELLPDAPGAAVAAVFAADDRARLPAGPAVEAVAAIDPTRRHGRIEPGVGEPLPGDVAGARDRCSVAVAAELVGLCRRALEMTVAYVKDRRQFGVPVGAFQAVQHTAAQMLRDTEAARVAVLQAAWCADAAPERLPLAAAMAKAAASDAGRSVTAAAIQLHGGVGFTWEENVHWLFKRAQVDAALLGGAGIHRARIAAALAA